jgi:purine-nucleoside phosphorylase
VEDAVAAVRARGWAGWRGAGSASADTEPAPAGLVLGSGLGALAEEVADATVVPYAEIPGMPVAAVAGHAGRLVLGTLAGTPCAVLQGRVHFYEGHGMDAATFGVRLLHALGVRTLILTNASGGLDPAYRPGDLMLIRDHIFLPGMAGFHPLRGPNDERRGPRFPAMVGAYDAGLRGLAREVAGVLGLALREGVYVMVAGPSFETSAELRFLRQAGADAVGMSTCPETVVARHLGMRVLGISLVANLALADQPEVLTHQAVMAAAERAAGEVAALIRGILPRVPAG